MSGRQPPSRRLSTHQQAVLIQVLLTFTDEPVGLKYRAGSQEAADYARDFLTIFKAINWQVESADAVADVPNGSTGLALITDLGKVPASAEALRDSLRIYGIEAELLSGPFQDGAKRFVLVVR